MLAGLGQDSVSGLGSTTAVLLPGVSSPPGIVFNSGSPALGSAAGTGSSQSSGPVLFSGTGFGTNSTPSGAGSSSAPNGPVLLSQYTGGSNAGGQGNGTGNTLSNADLWRLYWSGAGAGSSSSSSDEGSLADDPTISAQYTGGSGGGRITPLVYNPESDGPPVFHSGVWAGDDGGSQVVQVADNGTQPPKPDAATASVGLFDWWRNL